MPGRRRVVVTGLGAVTPIGNTSQAFWEAAVQGCCGIGRYTGEDGQQGKIKVAAEVKGFDPVALFGRKQVNRMDRYAQLGLAAALEAVQDAGLDSSALESWRFGVMAGCGVGGINTVLEEAEHLFRQGSSYVNPLLVPKFLPNALAGQIAIALGAKGPCGAAVTACAAGADAIGQAYRSIAWGDADAMVAGASESCINPLMLAGYANLGAHTLREDPARASIPFDGERDGFVLGEGAGMLVLEELSHALQRNARIYGEVTGYAATCDAWHPVAPAPDGEGSRRAMTQALACAGLLPAEISLINAHGTSTPLNDRLETEAIKQVFGEAAPQIPVNATKSLIGHLMGAAGAVEAVGCLKALEGGIIHPTIGLQIQDPACDLDYVTAGARKAGLRHIMSNSFGFGGHNAVLILSKFQEDGQKI